MFRNLSNSLLPAFLANLITVATNLGTNETTVGSELTELSDNSAAVIQIGQVSTNLSTKKIAFDSAIARQVQAQAEARAATESLNQVRDEIVSDISRLQLILRANGFSNEVFAALGLSKSMNPPTPIIPHTPVELSVTGYSNGENLLKFKRNGNGYGVNFVIESRVGLEDWKIAGITRRKKFSHDGQTPGGKVSYRVKAQSASSESQYSDVAVIYG